MDFRVLLGERGTEIRMVQHKKLVESEKSLLHHKNDRDWTIETMKICTTANISS